MDVSLLKSMRQSYGNNGGSVIGSTILEIKVSRVRLGQAIT